MTHILIQDEARRQFDAGEIDQATYEALRGTRPAPAENLCQIPGCTRQAYRVDRGVIKCAVCFQKAENRRRRGW
jgi:hypothetical protein